MVNEIQHGKRETGLTHPFFFMLSRMPLVALTAGPITTADTHRVSPARLYSVHLGAAIRTFWVTLIGERANASDVLHALHTLDRLVVRTRLQVQKLQEVISTVSWMPQIKDGETTYSSHILNDGKVKSATSFLLEKRRQIIAFCSTAYGSADIEAAQEEIADNVGGKETRGASDEDHRWGSDCYLSH